MTQEGTLESKVGVSAAIVPADPSRGLSDSENGPLPRSSGQGSSITPLGRVTASTTALF